MVDYWANQSMFSLMKLLGHFHEKNSVIIKRLHFDGHEHYKRKLDEKRIVDRLKGLRDYCKVEIEKKVLEKSESLLHLYGKTVIIVKSGQKKRCNVNIWRNTALP